MAAADVMISYYESDYQFVKYLADELSKHGIDAWYLKPEDSKSPEKLKQKGQILLKCKVYLVVLSPESCNLPDIKDEMALAYISNKAIYPLGRKYYRPIAAKMEGGMKLMLAKINWTFFVKEEHFEDSMKNLTTMLQKELEVKAAAPPVNDDDDVEDDEDEVAKPHVVQHVPADLFAKNKDVDPVEDTTPEVCEHTNKDIQEDFWARHFQDQTDIQFIEFKEKFLLDYEEQIKEELGDDQPQFFVKLLYKDIFDKRDTITRLKYNKFVGKNKKRESDHFFERLREYSKGSLALREVLNMDSSVRLTAIENLAKFQTPTVLKVLYDFTEDMDPNIRAVAGLSLAKSGIKSKKIEEMLLKMLEDEDRVVRESACLSLAHMKCQRAVSAIVDLWRNDAIKHVREAAEIALARIGGEDANKAIQVTKVLQGEMENLRGDAT